MYKFIMDKGSFLIQQTCYFLYQEMPILKKIGDGIIYGNENEIEEKRATTV